MQIKTIAVSAIALAVAYGCASQQPINNTGESAEAKAAEVVDATTPAEPAKPALLTGASASMLANTCTGCHGTGGQSNGPATPTIAGLETDYFVEVMESYKSGERKNTIMGRLAKGYSDDEIAALAGYYGKMKYQGLIQTSVGPKARMGAKLHEEYCEKCHEDGGTSVEDTPLAGQMMPYLQWTISDYLDGHNNPEKKMTKAIEKMLSEHSGMSKSAIAESFAHYYGSHK